jgi:hypothetical protein
LTEISLDLGIATLRGPLAWIPLVLFPVSLAGTLLAGLSALAFARDKTGPLRFLGRGILFHGIVYALAVAVECVNPYWIDNGAKEFIPLADRWLWAIVTGGSVELVCLPLWIGYLVWARKSLIFWKARA